MSTSARAAVAVIGAGVKTPAGLDIPSLWESLCAARPAARAWVDRRLPPDACVFTCPIDGFDASRWLSTVERRRSDRAHQLAIAAAQDALDACAGTLPAAHRCAVVCGVGLGAPALQEEQYGRLAVAGAGAVAPLAIPMMMPGAVAAMLSLRFGFRGPCLTLCTACASGASAIAEGVELIRRGAADLVLAGGTDSMLCFGALVGFLRLDAMSRGPDGAALASRPFDVARDGFVMGEGAAFVVLLSPDAARSAGHRPLGFVLGHASTADAHHLVAPDPSGEGALACMRAALADAGVPPSDLSHVNAHGTSTPVGDLAEGLALAALFAGRRGPPVTAVKGCTGHLVAASGAVEAVVTLCSVGRLRVPPIAGLRTPDPRLDLDFVQQEPRALRAGPALSNSFGFGGVNTSLVLGPP